MRDSGWRVISSIHLLDEICNLTGGDAALIKLDDRSLQSIGVLKIAWQRGRMEIAVPISRDFQMQLSIACRQRALVIAVAAVACVPTVRIMLLISEKAASSVFRRALMAASNSERKSSVVAGLNSV